MEEKYKAYLDAVEELLNYLEKAFFRRENIDYELVKLLYERIQKEKVLIQ